MLHVKVIVEAVLDRRTDRELHMRIFIETLHRLRHDVRAGMAQGKSAARILKGEYLKRRVLRRGRHEIDRFAVEACRQCFFRERIAHLFHDVQ